MKKKKNISVFFHRATVYLWNDALYLIVGPEDDGVYQCVAENSVGMFVSYTWVHVRGINSSDYLSFLNS